MTRYQIAYTTGTYDLFHVGHLNLLRSAKALCEYLIVGVNTDEITFSYKNQYPVIPFQERLEIVKAIKYVDKAIPQDSIDKMAAWNKLHFDVLIHGDDRKGSKRFQFIENQLSSVGVDLIFLPYTKSTSSTMIRKVIEKGLLKNN